MDEVRDLLISLLDLVEKKLEAWREAEQVRSRHEVIRSFSALALTDDEEYHEGPFLELGTVLHFTEGYHVIEKSPAAPLLDSDVKICNERGLVVGVLDEVLGTVETPYYSALAYHRLAPGCKVYYTNNHKLLPTISTKKGTDSSNWFDEERVVSSSDEDAELEEGEVGESIVLPAKRHFSIFEAPPKLD